jgi:mRNA interferase MazF
MMPPSMHAKRGDIILVLFPNSDLRSAKVRPALVVQSDNLRTGLPQVIVAMITSNMRRAGHPSRVMIARSSPEGRRSGLLVDSVVMADNLATIAEVTIEHIIGSLTMTEIDSALRRTLHLH